MYSFALAWNASFRTTRWQTGTPGRIAWPKFNRYRNNSKSKKHPGRCKHRATLLSSGTLEGATSHEILHKILVTLLRLNTAWYHECWVKLKNIGAIFNKFSCGYWMMTKQSQRSNPKVKADAHLYQNLKHTDKNMRPSTYLQWIIAIRKYTICIGVITTQKRLRFSYLGLIIIKRTGFRVIII